MEVITKDKETYHYDGYRRALWSRTKTHKSKIPLTQHRHAVAELTRSLMEVLVTINHEMLIALVRVFFI